MEIGEAWIEGIEPAPKSRDDMPARLGWLVVESGHGVVGKKLGAPL